MNMKESRIIYILLTILMMAIPLVSEAFVFDENGFRYIEYDDLTAAVYNCPDVDTLRIPSHVIYNGLTYTVTSIRYIVNPFPSNGIRADDVVHISLPNTIKTIGDNAFENLYRLRSIDMSNSLITIGDSAFKSCPLLEITLPNTVTSIGRSAFASCWYLTHMDLSNTSISKIEEDTFWGCMNLESIDLPSSVATIGRHAFASSGLRHIVLPEGLMSIGWGAFVHCESLTSVILPESLTTIYGSAFADDDLIQGLYIPKNVSYVAHDIIASCDNVQWLIVDHENPTYDSRDDCNAIIHTADNTLIQGSPVTIIPESVTTIDSYAFQNIDIPATFTIPNSIKIIGDSAFWGCNKLVNLEIPESTEWIGDFSFYGCRSLNSITLPASLIHIGEKAFIDCKETKNIKIYHSEPIAINENAFENKVYENAWLHVPQGCIEKYRNADGWKRFVHITGDLILPIPEDVNGDGEINIGDANSVVVIIVNGGGNGHTRPDGKEIDGDVNGDGEINIADINAIIRAILNN